ncbi:MAG: hypothetical protein OEZ01_18020 [Candidatus Heimdallarchaeota archaeon]|nr:hypothetical protein [Candidatus Heimdallarchaeota archaeon]
MITFAFSIRCGQYQFDFQKQNSDRRLTYESLLKFNGTRVQNAKLVQTKFLIIEFLLDFYG